jgi:hypothetical protein
MKRMLSWVGSYLVEGSRDDDDTKEKQTPPLITDPVKVVPKQELKIHKKLVDLLSVGKDKFESPSLQIPGFEGLTLEDLETLTPGFLISSSVMNIWLKLLQRTLNKKGVKTLCLSSHFFTKLTKSMGCEQLDGSWKLDSSSNEFYCYKSVKRWTRQKRLPEGCKTFLDLDIILFPVHLKSRYHWMISIIHVKTRQLIVYNSLRVADFDEEEKWVAHIVERWWADEYRAKAVVFEQSTSTEISQSSRPVDLSSPLPLNRSLPKYRTTRRPREEDEKEEEIPKLWNVILTDLPQQVNSTDCGAFCLAYAYYACFHSVIPNKEWPSEFDGDNLRTSVGYNLLNQSPLLKDPDNISVPAAQTKNDDLALGDEDVVVIMNPKKRKIRNVTINLN